MEKLSKDIHKWLMLVKMLIVSQCVFNFFSKNHRKIECIFQKTKNSLLEGLSTFAFFFSQKKSLDFPIFRFSFRVGKKKPVYEMQSVKIVCFRDSECRKAFQIVCFSIINLYGMLCYP